MILFIYLKSIAMNCTKVTKQEKDATDSYHLLHPFGFPAVSDRDLPVLVRKKIRIERISFI